ncbi:MAG: MmgE/PrpD family protein [Hyphomicrobiales bacterium]|nr:MmgE/PrpD family protein [Hyphomicrobiales bacterium]
MTTETVSRLAARAFLGLAPASIPDAVRANARLHFLDGVGVGLAASAGPAGKAYHGALARLGSTGACTVFGSSSGAPVADAALANGGMMHALEYDDTHMGSIVHGSAVLAAAALAVAEAEGSSGEAMLAAYVKGWEFLIRVGLAAPGAFQQEGFQITITAGVMAAALIACDLQGASEDQAVAALGIALSQASGVFEFLTNGATVKSLHPGWAAHGGIVAAALAMSGLTGPETALDGRLGLFARFAGRREAAQEFAGLLASFGRQWLLLDAAFKFYPCCHYIHPYLTACDALAERGVQPSDIASINCKVAPGAAPIICDPWERRLAPTSAHEMRYSLPVVLALRLLEGEVALEAFERPASAEVLTFARRIAWEPLEPNAFPRKFEAFLTVHTFSGEKHIIAVDDVRGGPNYPAGVADVLAKFRSNARRVGPEPSIDRIIEAVNLLDQRPIYELSTSIRVSLL